MAQYFDAEPETASDRRTVEYRVNGVNLEFITDSNVFSRNEIDHGTDIMINAIYRDIKAGGLACGADGEFLDAGCGYGPVGITMRRFFRGFKVTQLDINSRAVGLAKENAELNRIPIKRVLESDVLSALDDSDMFDVVAVNPPVRAGKKTVFEFYEQAKKHMKDGASIYVVLQRKQGAPSSEKKLNELFGNCETIEIESGYHVMKAKKV